MIDCQFSRRPTPQVRPAPLAYELDIVRMVDPEAAAFDSAKEAGFLVVGNDVGDGGDFHSGMPERTSKDRLVWRSYSSWCRVAGRPLVWVAVVMTGVEEGLPRGEKIPDHPDAEVRLRLDRDRVLDEGAIRRIALPGKLISPSHVMDEGEVHLRVGLPEALGVARGLLAIASDAAPGRDVS